MRPTRLELEGFASFRDRTCLEFGPDLDLFVFAGRTGSGKSSLLDAIVFSLYGSVPRYPSKNWVAPVVSQGLNRARVRLTFEVGGTTYAATRVVRRTDGGASTREARLEVLRDGDVVATPAGSASELTEEVERVLGLSFDHFVRTVVLPQGAFQEFMHARPGERQDLLVELLGLDVYRRIASTARSQAREAEQAVELLERRLEGELSGATGEAVTSAEERVATLRKLREEVRATAPRLHELREEGGRLSEAARAARERADRLEDLGAPADVDDLTAAGERAEQAVEDARGALEEAEEELGAAEAARDRLPDPDLVARLERLRHRAGTLDERLETAAARRREAGDRGREATRRAARADQKAERARTALEEVRRADLAATLAAGLAAGDDCPVCDRPLEDAPRHHATAAVEDAERRHDRAVAVARRADAAAREAEVALAEARSREEGRREDREQVSAELREAAAELGEQIARAGELRAQLTDAGLVPERLAPGESAAAEDPDPIPVRLARRLTGPEVLEALRDRLAAAGERLEAAREAAATARTRRRDAEEARDDLEDAHAEAWRVFDRTRDRLGGLEPPPADRGDLAGSWAALVDWADTRRPELEKEAAEAEAAVTEARREYQRIRTGLVEVCGDRDVEVGERPPGEAVAAALERAEGRVERLAEQREQAEEIRGEIDERRSEARVARDLGTHLSARNFERWLMERALHRLVVGATEVLQQLTDGAYSLTLDDGNEFAVVDHRNADQPRSARTLSGGETFLASLALALALSEHVAELAAGSSARLEALFLDEGFGALDADTLDTVAAAIEELGARGRMVGLITHVRDLADRIPVRFEVRKTVGGSRVEKVVT